MLISLRHLRHAYAQTAKGDKHLPARRAPQIETRALPPHLQRDIGLVDDAAPLLPSNCPFGPV